MSAVKVRERGIIFTDTVPALLDGTKTQTRRPLKVDADDSVETWRSDGYGTWLGVARLATTGGLGVPTTDIIRCPYGAPGDRFYVKERWDYFGGDEYIYQRDPGAVMYEAGSPLFQAGRRWRNPMFMPKWAARLWCELTDVRVQRVQDISEEDARAEGVDALDGLLDEAEVCRLAKLADCMATDNRAWFAAAWEMIHGRGAWERNDLVWALTFRREEPAR